MLLAAATLGCKKEQALQQEPTASQKMQSHTQQGNEEVQTVLGSKIANPYTLAIMTQAKQNLANRGIHPINSFTVRATHRYVKFSPANEQQLNIIERDTTIYLRDCPIDYAKVVKGGWYRQPGLPDSVPTPQYTAVRANYQFAAQVPYLIIENLYLPEEDTQLMGTNLRGDYTYLFHLLNEAYTIASGSNTNTIGNTTTEYFLPATPYTFDEYGGSGGSGPNGRIRVFDTRLNTLVPLEGAEVTANRWFTTHNGYTDANGDYYLSGSFDRVADFTLRFKRNGFKIKKNRLISSTVSSSNVAGNSWSHDLTDGMPQMWGHMFRAAYRYYYGDAAGLQRPYRAVADQILTAENSTATWGAGINYTLFPILRVARYQKDGNAFDSDEIYGITIHELAHTAHIITMNAGVIQYFQVSSQIRESWCTAVQWHLTNLEYRSRGLDDYGNETYTAPDLRRPHDRAYQWWTLAYDQEYTSLFINLVDAFNESTTGVPGRPNDAVSGYTLSSIQSTFLKNVYGLSSLASELKAHKPAGVTNAQIDQLISSY